MTTAARMEETIVSQLSFNQSFVNSAFLVLRDVSLVITNDYSINYCYLYYDVNRALFVSAYCVSLEDAPEVVGILLSFGGSFHFSYLLQSSLSYFALPV